MTIIDAIRLDRERQLREGPPEICIDILVADHKGKNRGRLVSIRLDNELWRTIATWAEVRGVVYGEVIMEAIRKGLPERRGLAQVGTGNAEPQAALL